jgi:magnesium-transporting ATPase (P-type)
MAEILFFALALIFNLPLPLVAIQLLWLNLVTDGIQDVALAFEKGDKSIMKEKPRDPSEKIFNKELIFSTILSGLTIGIIVFILWYYLVNVINLDITKARTYILFVMVFMQNLHALNCRSFNKSVFRIPFKNNYFIILGITATIVLHLLVSQHLTFILDTVKLTNHEILNMLFLSLPILLVMEVYKAFIRKGENK